MSSFIWVVIFEVEPWLLIWVEKMNHLKAQAGISQFGTVKVIFHQAEFSARNDIFFCLRVVFHKAEFSAQNDIFLTFDTHSPPSGL